MSGRFSVGVIGYGNMASAIVGGAHRNGIFTPSDTFVYDKKPEALDAAARGAGMNICGSTAEVVSRCDVLLLAVKPQQIDDVLAGTGSAYGKCVISIVTGVTIGYLAKALPGAHIIRVMPNTPIMLGCGAAAISAGDDVPKVFTDFALGIFSGAGIAEIIPEEQMNAVVPINGSSPAFFFRLAELALEKAEEYGISRDAALRLFAATMEGSARMLLDSGKTPEELRIQVCSPGGTTLAALDAMKSGGFDSSFLAGIDACISRAAELGKSE